jgi:hypothetical protein
MNYTEIVEKLIGEIKSIGESNTDEIRFENLVNMCNLVNNLIVEIDNMAYLNMNRKEASMNKAGQYAYKFLFETLNIKE